MQTVIINRDSWHYRVATFLDKEWQQPREDFCSYVRGFLKTIVGCSFMVFMAGMALLSVGVLLWGAGAILAWFVACLLYGFYLDVAVPLGMAGWTVIGAIAINRYKPNVTRLIEEKNPEIVKAAWRSFHDKTCFRLRLVDGDGR